MLKRKRTAKTFFWGVLTLASVMVTQPALAVDPAIQVVSSGDVGIGTTTPVNKLHVRKDVSGVTELLFLENDSGQPRFTLRNGVANRQWNFQLTNGNQFRFVETSDPAPEFILTPDGNLTLKGNLVTGGTGTCNPGPCDGVFQPTFQVESIDDHADFMWKNSFLKGVGPTSEGAPLDVNQKIGGTINELEKAHIYIERLHERMKAGEGEAQRKDVRIADLEQRIARLESALATALTDR